MARRRTRAALERTAYHEAGHVVVGSALGLVLIDTDLDMDSEGDFGHTNFEPYSYPAPPHRSREDFADRVAVTLMAGFAAESRHAGYKRWAGSGFDFRDAARDWLGPNGLDPPGRRRRLEDLRRRAQAIIDGAEIWAAIQAVAGALLEHGRLTGADANRILHDTPPVPGGGGVALPDLSAVKKPGE